MGAPGHEGQESSIGHLLPLSRATLCTAAAWHSQATFMCTLNKGAQTELRSPLKARKESTQGPRDPDLADCGHTETSAFLPHSVCSRVLQDWLRGGERSGGARHDRTARPFMSHSGLVLRIGLQLHRAEMTMVQSEHQAVDGVGWLPGASKAAHGLSYHPRVRRPRRWQPGWSPGKNASSPSPSVPSREANLVCGLGPALTVRASPLPPSGGSRPPRQGSLSMKDFTQSHGKRLPDLQVQGWGGDLRRGLCPVRHTERAFGCGG